MPLYTGSKTREISFPLGGIGTGAIGLAGNGRLVDWEIFNRPNKGSVNGFSHFSIKAERAGQVIDSRVLHGDLGQSYFLNTTVNQAIADHLPVTASLAGAACQAETPPCST